MEKKELERLEAIASLRKIVIAGDTVHTILRHVSRSGMLRHIDVFIGVHNISYLVSDALDYRRANDGSLKVGGCGMDMGFSVVHNLSYALYPVYKCLGEKCGSGDHVNGPKPIKRIKGRYTHKDGYAINQKWL